MKLFKRIKPEFVDDRGGITKLLDDGKSNIKSTLLITSKAGTIRSDHYHKNDTHYMYMISGEMEYFEKPVQGGRTRKVILKAGDMVYTPPMMIHTSRFLKDSVFITLSTKSRSQKAYEKDTIRVPSLIK